jgi:hypothetical protein
VQGGLGWNCGSASTTSACIHTTSATPGAGLGTVNYFNFSENDYYDADTSLGDAGDMASSSAFYTANPGCAESGSALVSNPETYQPVQFAASLSGSWKGAAGIQLGEDAPVGLSNASTTGMPSFSGPACGTDDYTLTNTTIPTLIGFTPWTYSTGRTVTTLNAPATIPAGFPLYFPGGGTSLSYSGGYCGWY